MDSLKWVDQTYIQKHASEDPTTLRAMYYPNLTLYTGQAPKIKKEDKKPVLKATLLVLERFGRKAAISLGVYCLTFVPVIGRFVLPAASYYTFNKAVGPVPATVIFGSGFFLPKRYLVQFLQAYFSSRSLMRDLVSVRGLLLLRIVLRFCSSTRTSLASHSPGIKSANGSSIEKASFLASVLASTSSLRFHCWACSSTVSLKLQPRTSSPKSQIRLHHQPIWRLLWRVRSGGQISMNS